MQPTQYTREQSTITHGQAEGRITSLIPLPLQPRPSCHNEHLPSTGTTPIDSEVFTDVYSA